MLIAVGPKFGKGEVLGSCGLSVHKSINVYLSLFDTCESVIMSSSSIFSAGLLKFCLYSSFSSFYR